MVREKEVHGAGILYLLSREGPSHKILRLVKPGADTRTQEVANSEQRWQMKGEVIRISWSLATINSKDEVVRYGGVSLVFG
jgi:hypothetical protein